MTEDTNKRKFWWIWAAWGILFVIIEVYALITKEVLVPTLSRTGWWIFDYQVRLRKDPDTRLTFKPFRIIGMIIAVWLPLHLFGGECALGIC